MPHPPRAVVGHVLHAALARRQQLRDRADVLLGHVDRQALDGLVTLAVDLALDAHAAGRRSARSPRGASSPRAPPAAARRGPAPRRCPGARSRARAARRCRRAPASGAPRSAGPSACSPSLPASGDVLTPIVIDIAGSSTVITGSGRGSSGSASVSPIVTSAIPATAMISPGPASGGVDAVQRVGHVQLGHLRALDRCRRRGTTRSAGPCLMFPWRTRQIASRPT